MAELSLDPEVLAELCSAETEGRSAETLRVYSGNPKAIHEVIVFGTMGRVLWITVNPEQPLSFA